MAPKKEAKAEPVKPEGLRILSLQVENVKRIKVVRFEPQGNVIEVGGGNGEGKTSLLDAIAWGLQGQGEIPSEPIRAGQGHATITMDLGQYIVKRSFSRVDPEKSDKGNKYHTKFTIEGKDRSTFKSPQSLLDGFMGAFTFDPLAFMRLKPKEQLEALRKVVVFDVDIDKLELERQEAYDARRIKTRELENAKARLAGMAEPPADLPSTPIDTAALAQALADAGRANEAIATLERRKKDVGSEIERLRSKVNDLRSSAYELLTQAAKIDGRLKFDWEFSNSSGGDLDGGRIAELTAEQSTFDIPSRVDVGSLTQQLQDAQTTNSQIHAASAYTGQQTAIEKLTAEFTALDTTVSEKIATRKKAIETAKMPIEGLSVGAEEVLLRGLPFGQASTAEQIKASAAMAMALSPKLRVMRIMDGSLLDGKSMGVIREMAERENYQVWVERVGRGGVSIVMEDGEATGDGVQPAEKF